MYIQYILHVPSETFDFPAADLLDVQSTSETGNLTADSIWGVLRGLETFTHLLTPSGDGPNVR